MESQQNRQFHLITASFFGVDWVFCRDQVRIVTLVSYLRWLFSNSFPLGSYYAYQIPTLPTYPSLRMRDAQKKLSVPRLLVFFNAISP